MKGKYIFGTFFVVCIAALAFYKSYDYTVKWEENNKKTDITQEEENNVSIERIMQVDTNNETKTSNTTKYILEYYNSKDFTLREENLPIPGEFVGLSREELIDKLKDYEENPNSQDVNQGFVKFELVSFSDENIVLRKTYHPYDEQRKYVIKANGAYVSVFYYETNELYENTTIRLDNLPTEVRNQIQNQTYITNIKELYDFLENYSS